MRSTELPVRASKRARRGAALATFVVVAAATATVLTVPAAAQSYRVTVELADGSLQSVVVELPEGTTLESIGQLPGVEGTPVSLEALAVEQPPPPPPEPPPPPPEPPAEEPPSDAPPPGEPPTTPEPPSGDPAPPGEQPQADAPAAGAPDAPSGPSGPSPKMPRDTPAPGTEFQPKPDDWRVPGPEGGGGPGGRRVEDDWELAPEERPDGTRTEPLRRPDGSPTPSNPGFVDALPGPSTASGVPNFIIRKFRVPPFLLPIYQAAGIEYGIRWEILAAINEIETDYGRNLNVSSAGALGWMQFMPPTWAAYGTDANKDGRKDPYNPVDAIFAAARYLAAAGYDQDVRRAIFAYNHADWYVDSVLLRARLIAGVPADLIGSLTGLTEGRFPVDARATYADDLEESGGSDRSIDIFAERGAPVVAINDGVIRAAGRDTLVLEDVYGNRFGYTHLGSTRAGLERGSRVIAGRVIGRVGLEADGMAPHLELSIRPGGVGAPTIDPKPILDGWKLLEATAIYRANGENVLRGGASLGQVLLLSKSLLAKRVLADDRIDVYECGREDIRAGLIDRRVLAALAYLAESGLEPTVTSLRCGHGYYTKSGNVSHHSSGNAVDIAQINGISVMGHQEPGGITDQAVRRLAQLQGALAPTQIISLFDLGGTTLSMADHADHIHVGFQPAGGESGRPHSVLKPDQWPRLLERLRDLENPEIRASDQD